MKVREVAWIECINKTLLNLNLKIITSYNYLVLNCYKDDIINLNLNLPYLNQSIKLKNICKGVLIYDF